MSLTADERAALLAQAAGRHAPKPLARTSAPAPEPAVDAGPAPDSFDALLAGSGLELVDTPLPVAELEPEPAPEQEPAPDPVPASAPEAKPEPPAWPAGLACPHCGSEAGDPRGAEPTDDDRFDWGAARLAGVGFERDYPLLGGRLVLRFRTLAVGEADAVHRQLSADRAAGRCPTELHWHVRRDRYRLALQLREVRRDGVPDAPPLADGLSREAAPKAKMVWQPDPADPRPPLEQLSELVLGRVLDDETLATTALTRLAHFNRLCLALAAEEQGPDFFPARRPSPP